MKYCPKYKTKKNEVISFEFNQVTGLPRRLYQFAKLT